LHKLLLKYEVKCISIVCEQHYCEVLEIDAFNVDELKLDYAAAENENADGTKHIMKLAYINAVFKCFPRIYKLGYNYRIV
jgi:hypothetical protein